MEQLRRRSRLNDLAHWQTALAVGDAESAGRMLRGSACPSPSPEVVAPGERVLGFTKALLIRDPDGHALEVIEYLAPRDGRPAPHDARARRAWPASLFGR